MRRILWISAVLLLIASQPALAIQLHWSNGATDLSVTQNTQAVLVVQADSAEAGLPGEWRLSWAADSGGIQFSAIGALACLADTAKIDSIIPPLTAADSAGNLVTAYFCSTNGNAPSAYYLVDLPAGSHGKLRVVALNPGNPTQVIESNDATVNGGIKGDYAPALLVASSVHTSLRFQLTAIGSGLQRTSSIALLAPDASWTVPLSVTKVSENSVTATALLAAPVPSCVVNLAASAAPATSVSLAAESMPGSPESGGCISFFREGLLTPASGLIDEIQPKDFAFVKGYVDTTIQQYMLHLFYTRQNQELSNNHLDDLTTKNIGHTVSGDFSWSSKSDTTFLPVRAGHFDNFHVWAPTAVLQFPWYYVFYTGVDSLFHQRIGVTRSQSLLASSWDRADTSVFDITKSNWAARGIYLSGVNCRDPFVMQDPDNPSIWLMYYVAVDSASVSAGSPQMAVGVARSYGDMYSWKDSTELVSTKRPVFGKQATIIESPHVFRHNGQWWMPYTVNQDSVFFETTADGPVAAASAWNGPVCLRSVVQGHPTTQAYYHASEYLQVNRSEYLAAFDDASMAIDIQQMLPVSADSAALDSLNLGCPQPAAVDGKNALPDKVRLVVSGLAWGATRVTMLIDLPQREQARVDVYDVLGRRCRTILDGELAAGSTRLWWNCLDKENARVASGVYFVRLVYGRGAVTQRTVVIR